MSDVQDESEYTGTEEEEEVEDEVPKRSRHLSGYHLFLQNNSVCYFHTYV